MHTFCVNSLIWIMTLHQVLALSSHVHGVDRSILDTELTNGSRNISEVEDMSETSHSREHDQSSSGNVQETSQQHEETSPSEHHAGSSQPGPGLEETRLSEQHHAGSSQPGPGLEETSSSGQHYDKSKKYHYDAMMIPKEILLPAWQQMCSVEYKLVAGSNFTAQNSFLVSCDLTETDHWSMYDYRKWISTNENTFYKYLPINESLQFAFEFKCLNRNGSLVLPWPAKAKHLWYISVSNCNVYDFLAEFNINFNTPDILRVAEYIDVDFKINTAQLFKMMRSDYTTISKQFDCGGEARERFVKRNCTESIMDFIEPEVSKILSIDNVKDPMMNTSMNTSDIEPLTEHVFDIVDESEMMNIISKFGQDNQKIQHQCMFQNLRYIDISYSSNIPLHHSEYLTDRRKHPALEYYNMSHSSLIKIPNNFIPWRRYFPKMKYLDLSHNKIKYFTTLTDQGLRSDPMGILDIRHNNVTTLTSDDLKTLRVMSETVYVDLRDNPLHCDCKLTNFVKELKNTSSKVMINYKYLTTMTCSRPEKFKGQLVSQLENDFCETLEVIIFAAPLVILSTGFLILITVLVLTIKCRKEIMILAFTRLHISLPCRKVIKNEDKTYDAFIAYSEADGDWVFETLLHRLEMSTENNGPGFKLCIHHRDFPVGVCIADNIVDKVKVSHHTVLILSNNFLLSHWCKYEFKTALTQSLMEKKQHLIIIIKEELDKHLIDKDLNRCLKTFTYVKADDRLFWDKIIFALSDHERIVEKQQKNDAIAINIINNNEPNINLNNNVVENRNNNRGNQGQQNGRQEPGGRMINNGMVQDGIWII